ncbi:hypothetical protein CSA37_12070 [Candidatus Fermentibacteria bacterium]|nr:MAG: hypothetical protein CSA37_12070 [Candidatus Fermentibacteria bacterium]
MITNIVLLALLGSWGTMAVPGNWVSAGGRYGTPPEITVLESDGEHALIQIDLSGYSVEETAGYTRFHIPGAGWNTGELPGQPEIPVISVVLGVPMGMTPEVSLADENREFVCTGRAYPTQPLQYDSAVEPFHFVELSASTAGVYPASTVSLHEPGVWAGVNTVVLQVNPVSWNSETGRFSVATRVIARVDFTGSREYQCSVRPEIAAMHSAGIVNYESLNIPLNDSPVSTDDVVYIVLVPEDNLDTITPFLAMVNSLGHRVSINIIDEGASSASVRAVITGLYQAGVTRFALIPARHQQIEGRNYGNFYGDYYYECMTSDNIPDIAVGRFPGDSSQLENQTEKAMSYVSYTGEPGVPSLPASVILCAHEENYPNKYTANSNAVANYDYALADVVFETCYPPEGGTAEQVQTAINNGVGIVNYRGHGSITTWQWSPGWNAGAIYDCTNTFYPPAFNVACSNGTHDKPYNCLCESWLDAPSVGASGTLGASAPSLTTVNNLFQKQLFKELFDTGNTCAGEMFAASQAYIIQQMPGGGVNNSRMYHWFGDPSMDIPNSDLEGAPFEISIDVPASVNSGDNSLTLTVTSEGVPVENAVVTITDGIGNHPEYNETFYVQETTSAAGTVTLNFTATGEGNLFYGVRLHNYSSVYGEIEVNSQGIQGGTEPSFYLSQVRPSPVRSSAAIEFTAPEGSHVNISLVDLAGRTVSTIHDMPAVSGVNQLNIDASSLLPGIYFVRMQAEGSSVTRKMAVVR